MTPPCEHPGFALEAELGHVESVDWDLGACTACGVPLLRQWSEYAPASTFYDRLTDDEANAFRRAQGRELITLLKAWYNDH